MGWTVSLSTAGRRAPCAVDQGPRGARCSGGSWWTRRWLEALEAWGRTAGSSAAAPLRARARSRSLRSRQGWRARGYRAHVPDLHRDRATQAPAQGRLAHGSRRAREPGALCRAVAGREMPEDIETVFRAAGLNLFLRRRVTSPPSAPAPTGRIRASTSRRSTTCWRRRSSVTRSPCCACAASTVASSWLSSAGGGGGGRAHDPCRSPAEGVSAAPLPVEPERFWGAPAERDRPLVATAGRRPRCSRVSAASRSGAGSGSSARPSLATTATPRRSGSRSCWGGPVAQDDTVPPVTAGFG